MLLISSIQLRTTEIPVYWFYTHDMVVKRNATFGGSKSSKEVVQILLSSLMIFVCLLSD
eukprot:TRINITY_DN459_c0_g1_i1.p1 TRINITY_DN459_c0_g1~~TRINITY_DN459_c0_g1_i1.p1  ORF type:complete len:59 (-),score=0.87 TRINITY_DN459_c0_g1_i1:109-285(-)